MSLEIIDTSYWLTKDKSWMEERKAQWPAIEKSVSLNRKKTETNVIKQYFLRGKMPKWEKYRDWNDIFRHLDLTMFLWLHPSNNPEVLKALHKDYMESELIDAQDIIAGYGSFLGHELMRATAPYTSLEEYPFPYMGEKNIILFRIMFNDMDYVKNAICSLVGGQENFDKKAKHVFEFLGFMHFLYIRSWLSQDPTLPLALNCLYQYDEVLEWCLTTMIADKNKNEFLDGLNTPAYLQAFQKALYCIHHFDTDKEGDTCRTRSVYKIRKILDEREFLPEFKQMWSDIKADKIEVKNPWKR